MTEHPLEPPASEDRAAAVADRIRAAWADVGAPGGPLVSCPCPECEELEAALRGVGWRDADAALADRHEQDLPLLDAAPYRALLPAFLLAALDPESEVGEFVVYSLEPSEFNTPRFEGLTEAQGAAVLAFLELDLKECEASNPVYAEEPRRAIEEYWGRFRPR